VITFELLASALRDGLFVLAFLSGLLFAKSAWKERKRGKTEDSRILNIRHPKGDKGEWENSR